MTTPGMHARSTGPAGPYAPPARLSLDRVRDSVTAWTEPAARHRRRVVRAQARARMGTVVAATSTGAAAVLVPWHGVGGPDAVWVALTAGTVTAAVLSWQRVRRLLASPPPPALPRHGSPARPVMDRLAAARAALATVLQSLGPLAGDTAADAAAADRSLGELAGRVVAVEAALACAPPAAAAGLLEARAMLVGTLDSGVRAYEDLVAAAAACVAVSAHEFGFPSVRESASASPQSAAAGPYPPAARLAESTDRLRGITIGLTELMSPVTPPAS